MLNFQAEFVCELMQQRNYFYTDSVMAGIYIHIPYCRKACHYCNFHFSTTLHSKNEFLQCLLQEIAEQKNYLKGQQIDTIYFGGGTPSVLTEIELSQILNQIRTHFSLGDKIEYTLEANPDDLSKEYLRMLARQGINRLSIGVQSFFDEDLTFMNRSHSADQAKNVIEAAQQEGIKNLSVDLIFGFSLLSDEKLMYNLHQVIDRQVPHVSCYAMTVEPRTALAHMIQSKKVEDVNPEQSARQFELVSDTLQKAGYEHYEISNYGKPGLHALHNSNYWKGVSYLGLGPSAHSFNGLSRRWNVSNNQQYISRIHMNEIAYEEETLTRIQQVNELIMISLRMQSGIEVKKLKDLMTPEEWLQFEHHSDEFILQNKLIRDKNYLRLSSNGRLFADFIASELFL